MSNLKYIQLYNRVKYFYFQKVSLQFVKITFNVLTLFKKKQLNTSSTFIICVILIIQDDLPKVSKKTHEDVMC